MNHSEKDMAKMAALGQMTRGLIHDFNNSLASIMGYAEFLTSDLPIGSEHHIFAENIRKAGFQLQDLIDQIKAISAEKNSGKDVRMNLVDELSHISERLQSYLGTGQNLIFSSDIDEAFITLPPHQLRILILNVVKNGIDALHHTKGMVTIHISKSTPPSPPHYQFTRQIVEPVKTHQPLIRIDVTDTGCGMNETHLGLTASAHFTTKSADAAHGIGLSVVKEIISYLDGGLTIATTPETGTCVTLTIPVESVTDITTSHIFITPKTILLIEDREMVRHTIATMLKREGHSVIDVSDGMMALDMIRETPNKFDLLITDYRMPSINGKDLIDECRVDFPNLPVIILSGDHENFESIAENTKNIVMVSKPLTSQKLNQAISRLV